MLRVIPTRLNVFLAIIAVILLPMSGFSGESPKATYVGAAVCSQCHTKESQLWRGSHHDLAMQHATANSVLGRFDHQTFDYFGVRSEFYRKDERFYVRTDGADGKQKDFEIKYTLGFYPLQQYLIEFPDGRVQALGIAWDSRSKAEGGQRWFHLYPKENVKAGESIHWTGIDQNWNHMCAECHSTHLQKNFDLAGNRFDTSWSEIDVACEACHGPGSAHADWAAQPVKDRQQDNGLMTTANYQEKTQWRLEEGKTIAQPEKVVRTQAKTDLCARCHSRRSQIAESSGKEQSLLDTHLPELLTEGKYYPDGRMQDEVYNYGSLMQSKMHQAGVTCTDCHEPYSLKLKAEGNRVCTQCHRGSVYDSAKHHFHKEGGKGASCAGCHMPASTYMVVDRRHDHGFRVPRPDLTIKHVVPNACNDCHTRHNPQWALDKITKHFGHAPQGFQDYAVAFSHARAGNQEAHDELLKLVDNPAQPGIARATALWELRNYLTGASVKALEDALSDKEAIVRLGAAQSLADGPESLRAKLLRFIDDPVVSIRTLAAKELAHIAKDVLSVEQQVKLRTTIQEYIDSQKLNADRPEVHMNLGVFYSESGEYEKAETAYRNALRLDPKFSQAYINLADLKRLQQHEDEAESLLKEAIRIAPAMATTHHALGLLLIRAKRLSEALPELKKASHLDKANPHYGYVYAVALNNAGKPEEAIKILKKLLGVFPRNHEILRALVAFCKDTGHQDEVAVYLGRLKNIRP